MNRKTLNIFCVLCVSAVITGIICPPPAAYATTGSGAGSPMYYWRDNRQAATGSGTDDFSYNWVEIIGQGGTQIGAASLAPAFNLDCNTETNIPSASRGQKVLNYYDLWTGGPAYIYAYQFRIYKKGFISFYQGASPAEVTVNEDIPSGTCDYTLYPWWDDLILGDDSWVGYRLDGVTPYRRLVITWYHMYHTLLPYVEGEEAERSITFQAVIYEGIDPSSARPGEIVFNYKDAKFEYWSGGSKVELSSISRGASATIGIEYDGTRYVKYSKDTILVNTNTAILFTRTQYNVNVRMPSAPVKLLNTSDVVRRGSHQAYARFSLQTPSGSATWTAIRVDKLGTALDSEVVSVDIYKDSNGDGTWNIGDTLLGSGAFSNGNAIISTGETVTTTERYYFIVLRLKGDIGGGRTVGVRVRHRAYLGFAVSGANVGCLWDSNF